MQDITHEFRIFVFPPNGGESKWQNRIRTQVNVTSELEWMRKAVGVNEGVNLIGIKAVLREC